MADSLRKAVERLDVEAVARLVADGTRLGDDPATSALSLVPDLMSAVVNAAGADGNEGELDAMRVISLALIDACLAVRGDAEPLARQTIIRAAMIGAGDPIYSEALIQALVDGRMLGDALEQAVLNMISRRRRPAAGARAFEALSTAALEAFAGTSVAGNRHPAAVHAVLQLARQADDGDPDAAARAVDGAKRMLRAGVGLASIVSAKQLRGMAEPGAGSPLDRILRACDLVQPVTGRQGGGPGNQVFLGSSGSHLNPEDLRSLIEEAVANEVSRGVLISRLPTKSAPFRGGPRMGRSIVPGLVESVPFCGLVETLRGHPETNISPGLRALLRPLSSVEAEDLRCTGATSVDDCTQAGYCQLLVSAVHKGNVDIVRWLVDQGANPLSIRSRSSRSESGGSGNEETLGTILDRARAIDVTSDTEYGSPSSFGGPIRISRSRNVVPLEERQAAKASVVSCLEEAAKRFALSPVHTAALAGDHVRLRRILAAADDDRVTALEARGPAMRTLVHYAVMSLSVATLEAVMADLGGVDVNLDGGDDAFGQSPLFYAVDLDFAAGLEILLREAGHAMDVNATNVHAETPLGLAVRLARVDAAGALLRGGADPNHFLALHRTPLHMAAEAGHETMVAVLLDGGADPCLGVDGLLPIHLAAASAHAAVVLQLLAAATDRLNMARRVAVFTDHSGRLVSAAVATFAVGDAETLSVVLDAGGLADPDQDADDGASLSPLVRACSLGNLPSVEVLLAHGACVSRLGGACGGDLSPLAVAVLADHGPVVARLCAAATDRSDQVNFGALDLVRANGKSLILAAFEASALDAALAQIEAGGMDVPYEAVNRASSEPAHRFAPAVPAAATNPLSMAVLSGRVDVVAAILKACNGRPIFETGPDAALIFATALSKAPMEIIEALIAGLADLPSDRFGGAEGLLATVGELRGHRFALRVVAACGLELEYRDPLLGMPPEVVAYIFSHLDAASLGRCAAVCRTWCDLACDRHAWTVRVEALRLAALGFLRKVPPVSNFVVDVPDGFDPTAPLAADANPIEAYKLAATFARLEVERVWVRGVVTFCPATIETLTSAEGGGVTLHHRALNGIGEGVVVADFGAPGSYEAYVRVRSDGFAYQGMRWVGVYAPWATKPRPDEAKRVGCVTTRSGAMIIGSADAVMEAPGMLPKGAPCYTVSFWGSGADEAWTKLRHRGALKIATSDPLNHKYRFEPTFRASVARAHMRAVEDVEVDGVVLVRGTSTHGAGYAYSVADAAPDDLHAAEHMVAEGVAVSAFAPNDTHPVVFRMEPRGLASVKVLFETSEVDVSPEEMNAYGVNREDF